MRGKDHFLTSHDFPKSGSPPLARERPTRLTPSILASGITPACAGKTTKFPILKATSQDHPRLRGKDPKPHSLISYIPGSPPLARERHRHKRQRVCLHRITPACAGKTYKNRYFYKLIWDHPRLRGKDIYAENSIDEFIGSPPLARERLASLPKGSSTRRITPACAGKTLDWRILGYQS